MTKYEFGTMSLKEKVEAIAAQLAITVVVVDYGGAVNIEFSASPAKETAFKDELAKIGLKPIWKDGASL